MHSIQPDPLVSSSRRRLDRPARRDRPRALSPRPATCASASRTRAWFGIGALAALVVPGCDADVGGPDEVRATIATISVASGNHQRGNVGYLLARALVVRVTDARGEGVADVEVTWTVTSGGGLLSPLTGDAEPDSVLRTLTRTLTGAGGIDGVTAVLLTPTLPGTTRVVAAAAGLPDSPVIFTAEAIPPDWPSVSTSSLAYDRTTYNWRGCFGPECGSLGSYYERYVLHEDGTFGLQTSSSRFGFTEYRGTYSRVGTALAFEFDDDSRWEATGTLSGDCLIVEYNAMMGLDEFEDGEFCRPSETR